MAKINKDEKGLYVVTNGNKHRSGNIVGYWPSYVMDEGGCADGSKVNVKKISQSPLCRVQAPNGV